MHYFDIWQELGIAKTADKRAIKKAYSVRLKVVRPDSDPDGFKRLRAAYEQALAFATDYPDYDATETAEPETTAEQEHSSDQGQDAPTFTIDQLESLIGSQSTDTAEQAESEAVADAADNKDDDAFAYEPYDTPGQLSPEEVDEIVAKRQAEAAAKDTATDDNTGEDEFAYGPYETPGQLSTEQIDALIEQRKQREQEKNQRLLGLDPLDTPPEEFAKAWVTRITDALRQNEFAALELAQQTGDRLKDWPIDTAMEYEQQLLTMLAQREPPPMYLIAWVAEQFDLEDRFTQERQSSDQYGLMEYLVRNAKFHQDVLNWVEHHPCDPSIKTLVGHFDQTFYISGYDGEQALKFVNAFVAQFNRYQYAYFRPSILSWRNQQEEKTRDKTLVLLDQTARAMTLAERQASEHFLNPNYEEFHAFVEDNRQAMTMFRVYKRLRAVHHYHFSHWAPSFIHQWFEQNTPHLAKATEHIEERKQAYYTAQQPDEKQFSLRSFFGKAFFLIWVLIIVTRLIAPKDEPPPVFPNDLGGSSSSSGSGSTVGSPATDSLSAMLVLSEAQKRRWPVAGEAFALASDCGVRHSERRNSAIVLSGQAIGIFMRIGYRKNRYAPRTDAALEPVIRGLSVGYVNTFKRKCSLRRAEADTFIAANQLSADELIAFDLFSAEGHAKLRECLNRASTTVGDRARLGAKMATAADPRKNDKSSMTILRRYLKISMNCPIQ